MKSTPLAEPGRWRTSTSPATDSLALAALAIKIKSHALGFGSGALSVRAGVGQALFELDQPDLLHGNCAGGSTAAGSGGRLFRRGGMVASTSSMLTTFSAFVVPSGVASGDGSPFAGPLRSLTPLRSMMT